MYIRRIEYVIMVIFGLQGEIIRRLRYFLLFYSVFILLLLLLVTPTFIIIMPLFNPFCYIWRFFTSIIVLSVMNETATIFAKWFQNTFYSHSNDTLLKITSHIHTRVRLWLLSILSMNMRKIKTFYVIFIFHSNLKKEIFLRPLSFGRSSMRCDAMSKYIRSRPLFNSIYQQRNSK